MNIVITGGAGFIGSALVRYLAGDIGHKVLNVDDLSYAGNLAAIADVESLPNYHFSKTNILNQSSLEIIFEQFQPDVIFHLAAETHVDRSIMNPDVFVENNIVGTQRLLSATKNYLEKSRSRNTFRFIHVSTDEVFGELSADSETLFSETTPYNPRSPYAASKASSDHLVRAWVNTYEFPAIITNCSNNYGPYQNTEKLIPLTIMKALQTKPLPVYGTGEQIRDWLYVEDHVRALYEVFTKGTTGDSYNIGGCNEMRNIDVVMSVCSLLDGLRPLPPSSGICKYEELITFVPDRPGHDFRYAVDTSKILREINWSPNESFETGLRKTVQWYENFLNLS